MTVLYMFNPLFHAKMCVCVCVCVCVYVCEGGGVADASSQNKYETQNRLFKQLWNTVASDLYSAWGGA